MGSTSNQRKRFPRATVARRLAAWNPVRVPDLADYLDLTFADAQRQWERVLAREPRRRQESFFPVEVILAYSLFFLLNPHSFGGANIARVPDGVHRLAALCQRSASSFTSKMLNLDGSRPNAGRVEPEVYLRLSTEPDRFAVLYARAMSAARSVGIGPDRLPDLLGIEVGGRLEVMGQDEIGDAEIATLFDERRGEIAEMSAALALTEGETERLVEQRARIGQHRVAAPVLANYEHQCAFCGFASRSLPN